MLPPVLDSPVPGTPGSESVSRCSSGSRRDPTGPRNGGESVSAVRPFPFIFLVESALSLFFLFLQPGKLLAALLALIRRSAHAVLLSAPRFTLHAAREAPSGEGRSKREARPGRSGPVPPLSDGRLVVAALRAAAAAVAVARLVVRLVDLQLPAVQLLAVQRGHGGAGGVFGRHLDEAEALGAPGVAVGDHVDGDHLAVLGEELPKRVFARVIIHVADIDFLRHVDPPFRAGLSPRRSRCEQSLSTTGSRRSC